MKQSSIFISDYLCNDLVDYAAYDNIRKIPSYIDGLKLSQRKIIYTLFKKYKNEFVKTETLANVSAAFTNYLHGANNLSVVCGTLTQNFVGSNNYSLTTGNSGGWGCRLNPVVSAPRYTRLKLSDITKSLISEDDEEIVGKQYFEGEYIEPKFFIPTFPILFLNGSNGLSTGFSSVIFPRNPELIISYIKKRLSGVQKPRIEILPWFRGFKGTIIKGKTSNNYESVGVIKKINTTNYEITELPIGLEYQKYIEILDKLCEDKVIADYIDCCEPKDDSVLFKIKTTRQFTNRYKTNDELIKVFKLSKSLNEILNCIDENNRVREFNSIEEIIDSFIEIRLNFYNKRKEWMIQKYQNDIDILTSKYIFCKGIIDKKIKVSNTTKSNIIEQLDKINKIIKVDNSYEYLLRMPIYSITKEKIEELKNSVVDIKNSLLKLKETSIEQIWIDDLKNIKDLKQK